MEEKITAADPQPCPACQGSGMFAKGCNLFPCTQCNGTGIGHPDDPDHPNPGHSPVSS